MLKFRFPKELPPVPWKCDEGEVVATFRRPDELSIGVVIERDGVRTRIIGAAERGLIVVSVINEVICRDEDKEAVARAIILAEAGK